MKQEQRLIKDRTELFEDLDLARTAWLGAKAIGGGEVDLNVLDHLLDELWDLDLAIVRGHIVDYD